jgi:hypothetical protein
MFATLALGEMYPVTFLNACGGDLKRSVPSALPQTACTCAPTLRWEIAHGRRSGPGHRPARVIFRVDWIQRDVSHATVTSGYYWGPLGAESHMYTLEKKAGRWSVIKDVLACVS